jgi:hypothetical protein
MVYLTVQSVALPPAPAAGNFANTLVILLLLAIQGATGDVSSKEAEITWRVQVCRQHPTLNACCQCSLPLLSAGQACKTTGRTVRPTFASRPALLQFGIGTVICFCVMVYRWLYLTESKVWRAEHESVKQELRKEKDPATVSLCPAALPVYLEAASAAAERLGNTRLCLFRHDVCSRISY